VAPLVMPRIEYLPGSDPIEDAHALHVELDVKPLVGTCSPADGVDDVDSLGAWAS